MVNRGTAGGPANWPRGGYPAFPKPIGRRPSEVLAQQKDCRQGQPSLTDGEALSGLDGKITLVDKKSKGNADRSRQSCSMSHKIATPVCCSRYRWDVTVPREYMSGQRPPAGSLPTHTVGESWARAAPRSRTGLTRQITANSKAYEQPGRPSRWQTPASAHGIDRAGCGQRELGHRPRIERL